MPIVVTSASPAPSSPDAYVAAGRRTLAIGDVMMSNLGGTVDSLGVRWILEKVTGWEGSPATTSQGDQRANDHGYWLSPAYLPGRVISVEGSIGADWATANAAIARLQNALPLSDLATVTIYGGGDPLQADVRQEGEFLVDATAAKASFSFAMLAPDPRRYSVDVTTASTGLPITTGGLSLNGTGLSVGTGITVGATVASGVLSVSNGGTMATRPTLTVLGPSPAATITHLQSNRSLRFFDAVPAGHSLVIDTDRRTALLDGVAQRVITGTWFEYASGANDVAFSAATYNSSALLTSSHRNAWR